MCVRQTRTDDLNKQAGNKPISRWKPGQSGNPSGRPIGARSKFSEAKVADFAADWDKHGAGVLERVRMTDPATYLRVAAVLVPKELNVAVEQKTPGGLDAEDWQVLRRIVDLIKANAPGGELGPTLQMIENALRADQAKMIEAQ
jgi:hypothetical protein